MELGVSGKTALVTASSQGIGKAIACALVQEKVNVIICSRNFEKLARVRQEIYQKTSREVIVRTVDLSSVESVEKFLEDLQPYFTEISILVYNTGGPALGGFFDLEQVDWSNAYNLILRSYQMILLNLLPSMLQKEWGRVIAIGSLSSKQSANQLLISNTLRPAVLGFNKNLSIDFSCRGITFNTICPSGIKTLRVNELIEKRATIVGGSYEEEIKKYIGNIPAGRLGQPNEVADLVSFLVSERARFITGSCFSIDGGSLKSIF